MSTKKLSDRERLERLADALATEVIETPEDEVLAEVENVREEAEAARAVYHRALEIVAKRRLERARDGVKTRKAESPAALLVVMTLTQKRALLERVQKANQGSFTMAARNAGELGEEDLDAAIDALVRLGKIDGSGELQ